MYGRGSLLTLGRMNMKYAHIFMIALAIGCCVVALLQHPLMKWPTFMAIERIQQNFIRPNLTKEESDQLEFHLKWIRLNQAKSHSAYELTLNSLAFLSAFVVFQNLYLLRNKQEN